MVKYHWQKCPAKKIGKDCNKKYQEKERKRIGQKILSNQIIYAKQCKCNNAI